MHLNKLILSTFLVTFLFSCKRNEENPTVVEVKKTDLTYELVNTQMNFKDLLSTKDNIEEIFPGRILSVDTSNNQIRVSLFENYTKLPVRVLTHGFSQTLNAIPSFVEVKNFMEQVDNKNQRYSGGSGNKGLRIYDYNNVLNFFGTHDDIKEFTKLLPISKKSSRVSDNVSALVNFEQQINNSSFMVLPRKDELISPEEQKKIISNENLYYVNTVDYGHFYIWLLEGETDEDALKITMEKVFASKELNSEDLKILKEATLSVYIKSSNQKNPLIKQAKGKESILTLHHEFRQWIQDTDVNYDYPISYTLRSLNDFGPFQYTFKNSVFFPKK